MNNGTKHHGAVVPMITPVTASGELDEAAADWLLDSLVNGGVAGIFVLGTTGEAGSVPPQFRRRLVERAVRRVGGRCLIYAGLGESQPDEYDRANEYLQAGADAVVLRPPATKPVPAAELAGWFKNLLDKLEGPALLYNIPMVTGVSIPLDAVGQLLGHPRLVGFKDSENNPQRVEELLQRFGGRPDFSVFIGVGALMEKGLKLGADGIVPSVGNLVPEACRDLCTAARQGDWKVAAGHFARMSDVAALYQKGRTLNESLAALKAAVHCRGLCTPHVLPPLLPLTESEIKSLRGEMSRLHLLNGHA